MTKECPYSHAQCSSDLAFCGGYGCPLIKIGTYEEHPKWFSLTCWRGRMGRWDYFKLHLIFFLALGITVGVLFPVMAKAIKNDSSPLLTILFVLLAYFKWTADVRRFHDIGMSGWWVLVLRIFEVALLHLGVIFLLAWMFGGLDRAESPIREPSTSADLIFNPFFVIYGRMFLMAIGMILLLFFICLFDFLAFICFRGKRGPNKYGPDPASRRRTGDVSRTAQKVD